MKRTTTLLICILLIITLSCSASVYAYAVSGGIARTAASDSEAKETDLLDGLIIPEDEGLTVADKKALLNSAPLDPIVTHYEPMDKIVSEILSKIIKPNMDTYEKVIAIYDYLRDGTEYAYDFKSDAAINSMIFSAVNYKNNRDYIVLRDAYRMLTEKRGKCAHFSSAFVVLTRAIGLESYIATSTNSSTGLGGHFSSMMKLGDGLYYFDPVMGVVLEISGDMTDSCYFCYPMQNSNTSEYSYLKEQLEYFGKFETLPESVPIISNEPKGKTLGDKHFSFGSYPQTRVTDSALIEELNEQLNGVVMNQYPYSHGGGTYDSMVKSGYMSWADITYNNEKYRAVKIDDYRPKFIYTKQAKDYSMQSVTGYKPGDIYWFRFDPIEWRLTDDSNLLVADLALDSQPFNDELYLCEEGKMINGKRHYVFKDAQFTEPANDWEVSYIRGWLNDEFYNTAFTSEEKELILDTQLDPNYGDMNYFDYPGTTDKVFLLSKDEAERSEYYLAESADNRTAASTDYAQSQGACSRKTKTAGFGTTWLLRNPGTHSEDICVIDSKGSIHSAISAGCASTGIRPAIRVTSLNALIPETLATPRRLTVKATDTGQITLKSAVSNGADYYKFYCYSGESVSLERVVSSEKSLVVLNDLKTGTEYRFSAAAVRVDQNGKVIEESVQTTEEKQVCKTFVEPPAKLSAAPSGTGKITVSVDPVKGAVAYNIYRYVDADTAILCGTTENNKLELEGFLLGTTYAFWASSLSDDGYESDLSETRARCLCSSVPPKPANVTAVPAATDKITVSWDPVEGADSYNVFR
ncbi:MAG: hypothetical protein IJU73_01480, partial [Ruminococcus sp.]|nr:hypothetical protein [Ruminococcus sp.]